MLTDLKPALLVALILAAMAASKHAFRHQTTTTQQRAAVSSFSSPSSVRSTIPLLHGSGESAGQLQDR